MAKHYNDSQFALVLKHLESGKEINPNIAINQYGIYRLGAVIYCLKQEGYNIATRLEYFKKPSGRKGHYAVYRLEEKEI